MVEKSTSSVVKTILLISALSEKNPKVAVQLHLLLNMLNGWPRVFVNQPQIKENGLQRVVRQKTVLYTKLCQLQLL